MEILGGIYLDIVIIGGSDGPTQLYLAGNTAFVFIMLAIICLLVFGVVLWFSRNKKSKI